MKLRIIRVTNLLQPSVDRVIREEEHEYSCLLDVIEEQFHTEYAGDHADAQQLHVDQQTWYGSIVVSLNGELWPESMWTEVMPRDGDCVVISPMVGNPGLFRTLGTLALAATSIALIATGAGAGLGAALGIQTLSTATAVGNAILGAAINIGGNLLVGAIASLLTPTQKSQTPSYAFNGPHSLAQSGTVIPKGYGKFQSGGNIIASFVDVEGNDQYINALVSYGFGPGRYIGNLEINGKAIGTYRNVQYYTRLGTNTQTPIPNFNRVVNGFPQQTQCLATIPVMVPGTGSQTQILQVDVQFPGGVFFQTSKGNTIAAVVTYKVEYCPSGTNAWQPVLQPLTTADVVSYDPTTGIALVPHAWSLVATDMPPNSGIVYKLDDGPHTPGDVETVSMTVTNYDYNGHHYDYTRTFKGEWQPTRTDINQVLVLTWTDGYVDYINATTQTCYNRTNIYGLAPGKYDVQVTKIGSARIHDDVIPGDNFAPNIGQDMWLHSVNEVQLIDLAYPNMILVGVRALATSQLSGSDLNITAEITYGLRSKDNNLLPAELQAYEEDNPACVAADMMLDPLYGGGQYPGIKTANIQRFIDEWVAWANLNDELVDDGNGGSIRRHVANGVFDNESDLWSQLNVIGQMSRAQIVPMGRDYGVFVDQSDTPVQIFTMGNIVQDSFSETWLELDARANQVEVQFADATRNYKQDNPIVYMDPANQNAGVQIKNTRIQGKFITSPAQAWHLARFRERCNQFLLRSGSFSCSSDAIACRQGNVILLQHDVPEWGWGGRLLPGSNTNSLQLDRPDLHFLTGTAYNVIVLHPAVQRYTGLVTAAAAVVDVTGANVGTQLTLTAFDGAQRVTRAIFTAGTAEPVDCPVSKSSAGLITVQPPPGFVPASGMSYTLWDTDVMESVAVSGVSMNAEGLQVLALVAPLSQQPAPYAVYFYGPTGSQKLARVTSIRKQSDFRARIEWMDYGGGQYIDGTPAIGETSAIVSTNPNVTDLTGAETFQFIGGANVPFVVLSWKLGTNAIAVGVAIYMEIVTSGLSISNALPQMVARLDHYPTTFSMQVPVGQTMKFTVVGFDAAGNYAAFKASPTFTITPAGVTKNLLLGSSFNTGFTYWSVSPRTGDSIAPVLSDDGEAVYTVNASALTVPQTLLWQDISDSKWAVGEYLMLSAYFQTTAASGGSAPNGNLVAEIRFVGTGGTTTARAALAMAGTAIGLTRVTSASTQIPAGTTAISVVILVDGSSLSMPVGSTVIANHLLLEISSSTQTTASEWADLDINGKVLDFFSGSSASLRSQGSTLPVTSGAMSYTSTDVSLTPTWAYLGVLWPDGGQTYIVDGSAPVVTGLASETDYWAFPYFDVVTGKVEFITAGSDVGSPALLFSAYNPPADAACVYDGRVPLAPGGLKMTTASPGTIGGGFGGGGGSKFPPGHPIGQLPSQ